MFYLTQKQSCTQPIHINITIKKHQNTGQIDQNFPLVSCVSLREVLYEPSDISGSLLSMFDDCCSYIGLVSVGQHPDHMHVLFQLDSELRHDTGFLAILTPQL